MKINIVTIFPKLIDSFLDNAIIRRAVKEKIIEISIYNLRDYSKDKHNKVDDYAFGGKDGMVLQKDPFINLFDQENLKNIVYTSPQGVKLNNSVAKELSEKDEITLLCGHYEGIDERVIEKYVDLELSIGDYVLSGGELPSLVILDAITRFIPGFINKNSVDNDSFEGSLLDNAVYTRPYDQDVPKVYVSGNHKAIGLYKKKDQLYRTFFKRPDMLSELKESDKEEIKKIINEIIEKI